jgi:hypothetical protein
VNQMETIVFDPEVLKRPNPTNMTVSCECGRLSGNAEVFGIPRKNGSREYKLSYQVTGRFYEKRDLLHCVACGKPALSRGLPEAALPASEEKPE